MRKALIVGINNYDNYTELKGCVNDAEAVDLMLRFHEDGEPNFGTKVLLAKNNKTTVNKSTLKRQIELLFRDNNSDTALFYFSGHGHIEQTGGYLLTTDSSDGDDGMPLTDLLAIANSSNARNKIIILDCCHSGFAGSTSLAKDKAILANGLTILTASSMNQYSMEKNGSGIFTGLFVDALQGAAADLQGNISMGSIYAHIDRSLGPWSQRPIFKTNVEKFISLRKVNPAISVENLRLITKFFEKKTDEFNLNPSFEPTSPNPNEENGKIFKILQIYNSLNLVTPVDEEHMYFAAMNSKSCKLTYLGQHYWSLVNEKLI